MAIKYTVMRIPFFSTGLLYFLCEHEIQVRDGSKLKSKHNLQLHNYKLLQILLFGEKHSSSIFCRADVLFCVHFFTLAASDCLIIPDK